MTLVLVTGASGFIGTALAPALAAQGWRVRAAARHPRSLPFQAGIESVQMPDLAGPANWGPLLAGVTHVVHLAGIAHTGAALPEATYARVNAGATATLARAARASGVKRFVLMSSVRAQTGASAKGTISETTPPVPTDGYGRSKLAAEQAIAAELPGAWTALRPVLVLGPGVKGNLAVGFALRTPP